MTFGNWIAELPRLPLPFAFLLLLGLVVIIIAIVYGALRVAVAAWEYGSSAAEESRKETK